LTKIWKEVVYLKIFSENSPGETWTTTDDLSQYSNRQPLLNSSGYLPNVSPEVHHYFTLHGETGINEAYSVLRS
jgi:hypothetical protein